MLRFIVMAHILDGNRVRDAILAESKPRVAAMLRPPGLAVVLVGHDPASEIYVRNKVKACAELGIYSIKITPPSTIGTDELIDIVEDLNRRPEIDGILVQMPLPPHVDSKRVLLKVSPEKDVDGFHPCSIGALATGRPGPRACTPAGVIRLLHYYEIPIAGRRAVVVGRSDIVGKPLALLLLEENATVTVCHSKTRNLAEVCREGELLFAAMGRPAALTADFIRPGAVVVDIGVHRLTDRAQAEHIFRESPERLEAFARKGTALVGDTSPVDVAGLASAYTPVPGGVGPMTIATLMVNTIDSAERRQSC